jgi:hypothetical protein
MSMTNDDDPYKRGAAWLSPDGRPARIVTILEDPDGMFPGNAKGEPQVIVTGDENIPVYAVSVPAFVEYFTRPDGTAPQPVIPRQPTGAERN